MASSSSLMLASSILTAATGSLWALLYGAESERDQPLLDAPALLH